MNVSLFHGSAKPERPEGQDLSIHMLDTPMNKPSPLGGNKQVVIRFVAVKTLGIALVL